MNVVIGGCLKSEGSCVYLPLQAALSPSVYGRRKVRTPQSSIAGNARRFLTESGQVQQKVCTGNAVVKPGKLYAVKYQINQRLRVARPMLKGR